MTARPITSCDGADGSGDSSSHCLRGGSCLGLESLSVNCGLGLPRCCVGGVEVFFAKRGLFYIAGCSNMSPRVPTDSNSMVNATLPSICPAMHGFVFKLGLAFWGWQLCRGSGGSAVYNYCFGYL